MEQNTLLWSQKITGRGLSFHQFFGVSLRTLGLCLGLYYVDSKTYLTGLL